MVLIEPTVFEFMKSDLHYYKLFSVSRKRKAVEDFPDVEDEDDVREPIPQKRETLIQAGYEGYSMRSSANVNRGRVRSVFDGFRNFGNEASEF